MNETDAAVPPQPTLGMRTLFFCGNPLIALGLIFAGVLASVVGVLLDRTNLIGCGIALALSALGVLGILLYLSAQALCGWLREILGKVSSLHDEEVRKLVSPNPQPSYFRFGPLFRN